MTLLNVSLLVSFAFFLGAGQILLKMGVFIAQAQAQAISPNVWTFGIRLIQTWQFWAAILLCGSLVLLWAWILTVVPLTKAYPFVVLAFIFAAIMEFFFSEHHYQQNSSLAAPLSQLG